MTRLTTLRDKDPKEVARLLSLVSRSLLPNPGIGDVIQQTGADSAFVKAVLSEIRGYLRVPESDQSIKTHSQIYAFLSEEISKATLTNVALSNIEVRLGNRGELHPSQYEVRFPENILEQLEAMGNRKNYIVEAVTQPDKVLHLKAKYLSEDRDPRLTISIKLVAAKRVEDRFILFVLSTRTGHFHTVLVALRVYFTEVNLYEANDPIDIVKSFAGHFGLTFRLGDRTSKFMLHEAIRFERPLSPLNPVEDVRPIDMPVGHTYAAALYGGETEVKGSGGEYIGEVVLGFVVDLTEYLNMLRRHHVHLRQDIEEYLRHLKIPNISRNDTDYQ
ncbi:MAG TPA: hypothetical protein VJ866_23825 [Pyrinomonadaceae bacterium]|nr:hypothetical protein [Pyrinomonadaceae bacterium]